MWYDKMQSKPYYAFCPFLKMFNIVLHTGKLFFIHSFPSLKKPFTACNRRFKIVVAMFYFYYKGVVLVNAQIINTAFPFFDFLPFFSNSPFWYFFISSSFIIPIHFILSINIPLYKLLFIFWQIISILLFSSYHINTAMSIFWKIFLTKNRLPYSNLLYQFIYYLLNNL